MKSKIICLSIIAITISFYGNCLLAQSIHPRHDSILHNDAQRPCLVVNLDPEPKTLKAAWRDYIKDQFGFKMKGIGLFSNKDLLSAEEVKVESISEKSLDFYAHIVEDKNGSEMKVFAAKGYDIYVDPKNNPKESMEMQKILDSFLAGYLPKYYEEKVSDTQKRVDDLEDETADIRKGIANDSEKIEELNKEIEKLREAMKANNATLETAQEKLTARKLKLERIKAQIGK